MAAAPPEPAPAKIVMRQCSFIEKGPGLSEKDQFVKELIYNWFVLYPNNVFANESKAHDVTPSTHVRQVSTVRVGLSVASTDPSHISSLVKQKELKLLPWN